MTLLLIYPRAVGAARRRMAGCAAVAGVACAVAALAAVPAGAAYTAEIVGTTLNLVGDADSDELVLRIQAGVPTMLEVEVAGGGAPFVLDRSLFTDIVVTAGPGDDLVQVDEANGAFTDEDLVMDGGEGRDTLLGGTGEEIFIAGADDDLVHGGRGNDVALLGAGDDVATWMPGDGNDVIEGQDGADVLAFTGSNAAENLDLAPNGGRVRLFRDVAAINMDLDDVEQLDLSMLGAPDRVVVNNLSGTDMVRVNVDLAGVPGSGTGDGQLDQVVLYGTASPETVELVAEAGALRVEGLVVTLGVEGADPGLDRLDFLSEGPDRVNLTGSKKADVIGIAPSPLLGARVDFEGFPALVDITGAVTVGVQGLGGSDTLTGAPGLLALGVSLELFGGKGRDTLTGGDGNDRLFGEGGRDAVEGGGGNDLVFLGGGGDTFTWNPGDGSDMVEGEAGNDRLTFIGSAVAEIFTLFPSGAQLVLQRDVGANVMRVAGVEQVDLAALGGADTVTVEDLTGTEVKRVGVDLAGALGSDAGDASTDTVVVNGTAGVDRIRIGKAQGGVAVARPRASLRIAHPEVTDMLVVNGRGEVDKIKGDPASLASLLMLVINPD